MKNMIYLTQRSKEAEEEIKTNQSLAQLDKLTRFYTEYSLGNVEIATLTDAEKEQIKENIESTNGNT